MFGLSFKCPIVRNLNNLVRFLDIFIWILDNWANVLKPNDFVPFDLLLVQISDVQKGPKPEQNCYDFRHCLKNEPSEHGTKVNCPRTELVWLSDIHCTYIEKGALGSQ